MGKLGRKDIELYLKELGKRLAAVDKHIELQVFGGSAMALNYDTARTTDDIDGLFKHGVEIDSIIRDMGTEYGLGADWVNDNVKRTISKLSLSNGKMVKVIDEPGITCYVVPGDMLLATKAMIWARDEEADRNDIIYLCKMLKIKTGKDIEKIVQKYYPHQKGFMDYQIEYFEELAEKANR